jgi:glycosyltransferase involved in cell wall biosynthesis
MKVAINAVSAKRGGAVTYLQNVLPCLRRQIVGSRTPELVVWRSETPTGEVAWPDGVEYRSDAAATGGAGAKGNTLSRLYFDQVRLPRVLRAEGFDALFSSANFGPLRIERHHVLLVRNAAYFDPVFLGRLDSARARAHYTLQRWLTLRCIEAADVVLFPSQAMLDLVAMHTGGPAQNWRVVHYGTRHDLFRPDAPAPSPPAKKPVQLLNVSLYCDQKNLGTLLRAMRRLEGESPGGYRLTLTAGFAQDWLENDPYFPRFVEERDLYRRLHSTQVATDTDWSRYGSLPALYRASDVFVFPSYTESFGHPLLEAMAAGLPVVAADVPSSRELCGDAAVYFAPFDVRACADAIRRVGEDVELTGELRRRGAGRVAQFTWERHAAELARALVPREAP